MSTTTTILCPNCQCTLARDPTSTDADLTCPSCGSSFQVATDHTTDWNPSRERRSFGRFDLLERVGAGAFAAVFRARDRQLDRIVAIKLPRAAILAEPADRDRFMREARSVAQLRHPSIVSIHEVGEHDGLPFIVSDFVDGLSLADLLTSNQRLPRPAHEFVEELANALHYAHERGVIHRDVKPSNVMLDKDNQPHLMDFGLAKRETGETSITMDGQVLGTPAYMSPEQARGESNVVDRRSDVYSLGVVLYQLLTREVPFRGNTRMLLHQVLNTEPRLPRSLNDRIPKDLETICLKAMAKEPGRRYGTAAELAADLRRFRQGEPIKARPAGSIERAWRWARRRPTQAVLLAMTIVATAGALVSGVALLYSQRLKTAFHAEAQARQVAETALQHADAATYFHRITLADTALRDNNTRRAETLLDECPQHLRDWEWFHLKQRCHGALQVIETGFVGGAMGAIPVPGANCVAITGAYDFGLWDLSAGRFVWSRKGKLSFSDCLAMSPDGDVLAVGHLDGSITLVRMASGEELATLQAYRGKVRTVEFSTDGKALASAGEGAASITLTDPTTGQSLRSLTGHRGAVIKVAFDPTSRRLASASWDQTVKIWDQDSGVLLKDITSRQSSLTAVAFSPDGRHVASGSLDGSVVIWDSQTGAELRRDLLYDITVQSLAFSPDGLRLASCSSDGSCRIQALAGTNPTSTYRGHLGHVRSVRFLPDGDRLLTAGVDGTVRVWDVTTPPDAVQLVGRGNITMTSVQFSADGHSLLTTGLDHQVELRDAASGALRQSFAIRTATQHRPLLAANRELTHLAVWTADNALSLFDLTLGKRVGTIPHTGGVTSLAYSPSGEQLALADEQGRVHLLDPHTGKPPQALPNDKKPVWRLTFTPDGRRLVAVCGGRWVRIWDVVSSQLVLEFDAAGQEIDVMAVDGQGERLALANGNAIEVYRAATGERLHVLQGHGGSAHEICFHPNGRRLLSAGMDRTVRLWDLETGQEVLTLRGFANQVWGVAIDPSGTRIAATDQSQVLFIWNAEDPTPEWRARRLSRLEERRADWYRSQATVAADRRLWHAAEWFTTRLATTQASNTRALVQRGAVYLAQAKYELARADLAKAWQAADALLEPGANLALVHVSLGDDASHRQVVNDVLERFGATQDLSTASAVAWLCVRFGGALDDYRQPLALAQLAVERSQREPVFLNTLGAVFYRMGRHQEAIEVLTEATSKYDNWGGWLFLAMAHRQLGQGAEARRCLDRARELAPGRDRQTESRAAEVLEFRLILAEAEKGVGR